MDLTAFGVASYGVAALAYGVVAIIVLVSQPSNRRASLSASALAGSGVWATALTVLIARGGAVSPVAVVALDAAHLFLWTVCVLSWLASRRTRVLWTPSLAAGAWAVVFSLPVFSDSEWQSSVYAALTAMGLVALLVVEQVYRNAQKEQRTSLGLLCGAVGAIAIIDVFVFSQAFLLGAPAPFFWQVRGILNAALLPLLVLGIRRQAEWHRRLFLSRHVVFYTASLLGVGSYLLMMGLVAYVIRAEQGEWSVWLELAFLVVAVGVLVFVLFSTGIRARFRAFLVKHFYRSKYDYRLEWLRLTQSLGESGNLQVLAHRGLEAMARTVGSPRGDLWLAHNPGRYEWAASFGGDAPEQRLYEQQHPMVMFMASRLWVIDSEEYFTAPDRYDTAFGSPEDGILPDDAIVVPLDCQGALLGFVSLKKPPSAGRLNFEDHDILKTAGKQIAVVLAQSQALEQLAETRQFEAMNKMSTFLMHDLKNIIAQQQLVVSNAARFRQRPEFFDDAIATVRAGVERMRHVLEQLKGATLSPGGGRTDVSKVLIEVRSHCADRQPVPSIQRSDQSLVVNMDCARLTSVLTHFVRNAQDATPADGVIRLETIKTGTDVWCEVSDTGCGMDPVFLRDRLFRPFDSTKGDQGMGIGAYQVREMVRAAGGDVEVTSTPNAGTVFRLRLPLASDSVRAVEREA
jgi:putative PEP-CTERM system histidine kinase